MKAAMVRPAEVAAYETYHTRSNISERCYVWSRLIFIHSTVSLAAALTDCMKHHATFLRRMLRMLQHVSMCWENAASLCS